MRFCLGRTGGENSSTATGYSSLTVFAIFFNYPVHFVCFFTPAAPSSNVLVWRPSACLIFSPTLIRRRRGSFANVNRAHGAYSTWRTRGQHATRPAYIFVWLLRGRTYLLVFTGATLCYCGISCVPCPCVCLSQVGVLSKRLSWSSWFLA